MSTEETPQGPQGENQPAAPSTEQEQAKRPAAAPPTKKSRNPIERAVIWILILALVGFGLIELRANNGYTKSIAALREAEDKSFRTPMGKKGVEDQLFRKDLGDYLWYWPGVTEKKKGERIVLTYRWFSFVNFSNNNYEISIELDSNKDDALVRRIYFSHVEQAEEIELDKKKYVPYSGEQPMSVVTSGSKKASGRKKKTPKGASPRPKSAPKKKPKSGNKDKKTKDT